MKRAFADTLYWIALANARDPWHGAALQARDELGACHLTTTDEVLVEFLNSMSHGGSYVRNIATQIATSIQNNAHVTVVPQSRRTFAQGLRLYHRRADKQYSLTDCVSMMAMRSLGIELVLTHDHHFEQEGFQVLIRRLA